MMRLSDAQEQAVKYFGSPTLVSAGAGSGKTRTLVAKICHMIQKGYTPERILAITFTNKAAGEMKDRIQQQTGVDFERFPWVRTFHSACFKILKQHCELLGYKKSIQIWAEYQQKKAVSSIVVDTMGYDKKYVQALQSAISNAKNTGDPIQYLGRHPEVGPIKTHEVYKGYQKMLFQANAIDFDDIILLTRDLFKKHDQVRKLYKDLFEFILVDEYQDCNALQVEITDMLIKNGAFFAVGDDYQSIYGFRMSDVSFFLDFKRRYPDGKIIKLEQNYRSCDEIVQLGNAIIKHNTGQMPKQCFSDKYGANISCDDFYADSDEASFVAKQINRLRNAGIRYDQIAVLYRAKFVSYNFERALRFAGIPYQMVGSTGFFDRKEILDLNSYLNCTVFENDDPSFERVLNTPKRGVGPAALDKINAVRDEGQNLQQATRRAIEQKVLSPKICKAVSALFDLLDEIKPMNPGQALELIISRTQYHEHLKGYVNDDKDSLETRKENIQQLIHIAEQKQTLIEYLEEAALVKEDKESDESEKARVRLSTVHASKGLEYKAVFVVGLEEGLFPHNRCMGPEEIEEERRLFYVACTRAESELFLTRSSFRRGNYAAQSQFVSEIADRISKQRLAA